jgi:hypothetical protein
MGIFEDFVSAAVPQTVTLLVAGLPEVVMARLTYGIGTGAAGGAGVRHTSGEDIALPFSMVMTYITGVLIKYGVRR